MSAQTGAYWEKKNDNDEEEEVPVGNSKLFLNRRIHRDYRVNEIFRRKATKIEGADDAEDEDLDEYGLPKEKKEDKQAEEAIKEEEKKAETVVEEETEKKKVFKLLLVFILPAGNVIKLTCIISDSSVGKTRLVMS